MNDALGEQPAPFGAPETTLSPGQGGSYFETGRPRLGGLERPVRFDQQQIAILLAAADTIIPPAPDWPAPSEVGIVTFIGRYVTPSGYRNKHFPFAVEDEFKAGIDRLGPAFVASDEQDRVDAIARLEKNEDPLFEQLRALVYYGYYSRPEVVLAIRKNVAAGKDYHGPPLPYGYLETLEPWDEETLASASTHGSYLETDQVTRVDLSQLTWTK
jgi:hypothetical protein